MATLQEMQKEKRDLHEEITHLSKEIMIGHISEEKKKEMKAKIDSNTKRLIELNDLIRIHTRRKIE